MNDVDDYVRRIKNIFSGEGIRLESHNTEQEIKQEKSFFSSKPTEKTVYSAKMLSEQSSEKDFLALKQEIQAIQEKEKFQNNNSLSSFDNGNNMNVINNSINNNSTDNMSNSNINMNNINNNNVNNNNVNNNNINNNNINNSNVNDINRKNSNNNNNIYISNNESMSTINVFSYQQQHQQQQQHQHQQQQNQYEYNNEYQAPMHHPLKRLSKTTAQQIEFFLDKQQGQKESEIQQQQQRQIQARLSYGGPLIESYDSGMSSAASGCFSTNEASINASPIMDPNGNNNYCFPSDESMVRAVIRTYSADPSHASKNRTSPSIPVQQDYRQLYQQMQQKPPPYYAQQEPIPPHQQLRNMLIDSPSPTSTSREKEPSEIQKKATAEVLASLYRHSSESESSTRPSNSAESNQQHTYQSLSAPSSGTAAAFRVDGATAAAMQLSITTSQHQQEELHRFSSSPSCLASASCSSYSYSSSSSASSSRQSNSIERDLIQDTLAATLSEPMATSTLMRRNSDITSPNGASSLNVGSSSAENAHLASIIYKLSSTCEQTPPSSSSPPMPSRSLSLASALNTHPSQPPVPLEPGSIVDVKQSIAKCYSEASTELATTSTTAVGGGRGASKNKANCSNNKNKRQNIGKKYGKKSEVNKNSLQKGIQRQQQEQKQQQQDEEDHGYMMLDSTSSFTDTPSLSLHQESNHHLLVSHSYDKIEATCETTSTSSRTGGNVANNSANTFQCTYENCTKQLTTMRGIRKHVREIHLIPAKSSFSSSDLNPIREKVDLESVIEDDYIITVPKRESNKAATKNTHKKCRKLFGLKNKDRWCSKCKWKKACDRKFTPEDIEMIEAEKANYNK